MSQLVLDGKALAEELTSKIELPQGKPPTMVSFTNPDDPASMKYTNMKYQKALSLGIVFYIEPMLPEMTVKELTEKIEEYNQDDQINGIMIQLPLPVQLKSQTKQIVNTIDPEKDVDGLSEDSSFMPATVKGVLTLLDHYLPDWKEKSVAVVGSEGEVGKSLVRVLENRVSYLVKVDQEVGDIKTDLKDVEIICSATGVNNLIKDEYVQDGFVAVDIGLGDFDQSALDKASAYTPKIGGVGPMTIISLMENVVESAIWD